MITVKTLLKNKGKTIWSVSPGTSIIEALKLMAEKDIGAVLVMEQENLVGIFSERDYARKIIFLEQPPENTTVQEMMTAEISSAQPYHTLAECMAIMNDRHIRHLPVLDGEKLTGMISIRDVMGALIVEQEKDIETYEKLILDSDLDF